MSLSTYAKAAAGLVPGASRLPWVAGGGGEMPQVELVRAGIQGDPAHVAAYARVCGLRLRDELPATYPHILAFPLHMQLMTDGRFPIGAIGLVHIANRITVHRPLRIGERFDVTVRASGLEPHPKGRAFSLVSTAHVDGELVWEDVSTMLRRGGGTGDGGRDGTGAGAGEAPPFVAQWQLPGDLGRRYAAVSGDANPIHLHPLGARLFGFPRAIAHGMWTKARCLAALDGTLGGAYTVDVAFKRPLLLPGRAVFAAERDGDVTRFAVLGARSSDVVHLTGTVTR